MTKDELMQLADAYATQMIHAHYHPMMEARKALSDAIDAALEQARMDALEEAAEYFQLNDTNLFWGSQAAREVRALKEKA